MKKIVLITLILLGLVFSSCQSLGGGGSGGGSYQQGDLNNDEDITGVGLEVKFDLDDDWISQKRLDYVLTLENSGKDEVVITRDNFDLGTIEQDNSGSVFVFTSQSVEAFLSNIFKDGDLILYQNTKREFAGELFVADWYFNDNNKDSFEWFLEIEYPYKTHVKNNIIVDLSEPRDILDVTDRLEQAAPVKVTGVDAQPTIRSGEYRVDFTIQDRGPSFGSSERKVLIDNIDMDIGTEGLGGCIFYVEQGGNKIQLDGDEIALTKDRKSMVYSCDTSLSNFQGDEPITSTIFGTLEYDYGIKLDGTVRLPTDRLEGDQLFN